MKKAPVMQVNLLEDRAEVTMRFIAPEDDAAHVEVRAFIDTHSDSLIELAQTARPHMLAALQRAISILEQEDLEESPQSPGG